MAKLKLGAIADDKPVKLTVELARICPSRSARLRRGACARNRAADLRSSEAGRADAGAVHGDGSSFCKSAAQSQPAKGKG